MRCLMAPYDHPKASPQASTESSQEKERPLGDTPASTSSTPLIDPIDDKSQGIEEQEEYQYEISGL